MAAPVATYVQLPSDTSNSGKKNRTQTKVVGSDTVHEHYMVPTEGFTRTGRYIHASSVATFVTQAQAAISTSPGVFLHMSTAATGKVGVLRHVAIGWSQQGAAVISQTAPIMSVVRYQFANAHSGTTLSLLQTQTSSTTPSANVRSAPAGATISAGQIICSFQLPALVSTSATYGGYQVVYDAGEHYNRGSAVEFTTGEGVCIFQATSGTGSDTRSWTARLVWDEIDVS